MNKKLFNLTKLGKILIILLGLSLLIFVYSSNNKENRLEPSITEVQLALEEEQRIADDTKINAFIKSSVENLPGNWALYVKNLKTGSTYEVNADQTFTAASIYKLAVMYKTYHEIEKGNLGKNDTLVGNKAALDRRIFGENENGLEQDSNETNQTISLDVETALEDMITISDNYSALLLAERLGWQNIDDFLKANNIQNFNLVGPNSPNITVRAVGNLLEKIYRSQAVNSQYSQEMKNLLLAQEINDRIPKYLPKDVKVAHKTGELEGVRHDAGIVYGANADYLFVILSETPKPEEAIENMAELSQKIYAALENPDFLK